MWIVESYCFAIGEATKIAVDKLSVGIVGNTSKMTVREIKVDGLVAAVDGNQVVINVGSKAGVKVGDKLQVFRVTKEIKDPSTGQVIRRLTSTSGIVQATDVDNDSAVCTPLTGTDFKVGDRVRTQTQ